MVDPTAKFNTIHDLEVEGKRVLVRVDFNVPLEEGEILSDTRIKSALPTIEYLLEEEALPVITSHLGRPGGEVVEELKMDPVARRLDELLEDKGEVKKFDDCIGESVLTEVKDLEAGQVALLENTRFHPGEKKNDPDFVRELSKMGQVFLNDAFGMVHRQHASNYGVAEELPAGAGLLILKEVKALTPAVEDPDHPFVAIIGGKKASSKIGALWDMMERVDTFLIGGALAFTFLSAQGHMVGDSLVEDSMIDEVRDFLDKVDDDRKVELILPQDAKISQEFSAEGEVKTVKADKIPPGWMGIDIGPATIEEFSEKVKEAETVVWAGPLGGFELDPFKEGTRKVAQALADSSGYRVIGGGETGAAIGELGLEEEMDHVSTGGGACLGFLRGKELPALEVLKV